jgi:uncharacterized caspase-like protein
MVVAQGGIPVARFDKLRIATVCLFVLCVVSFLSTAEESARGILVGTLKPGLSVVIDKGCGALYAYGESLSVTVRAERSGYLTLFDFMPDGRVAVVFPNAYSQDNYIEGGKEYHIPGEIYPFVFRIGPPDGWEILYGVITDQRVELLPGVTYDYSQVLPQLPQNAVDTARGLARGITVMPASTWTAAAFCYFQVMTMPTSTPTTTPATTPPSASGEAGWALFLGVDDYDETAYTGEDGLKYRFPKLHYCAKGANAMANALSTTFPNQRVLVDREVTHDAVKQAITGWLSQAPENATVLIFYSGHGSQQRDTNGDEADGYDETVVPWDYGTKRQFIVDDELRQWLSGIRAKKVVLIFDSCHSGTMERGVMTAELVTTGTRALEPILTDGIAEDLGQTAASRGTTAWKELVISASPPDEPAYESSQLSSSVLTYYLLQALAGSGDANHDAWVTAKEAFQCAKGLIDTAFPKQHPQMADNILGEVRLSPVR